MKSPRPLFVLFVTVTAMSVVACGGGSDSSSLQAPLAVSVSTLSPGATVQITVTNTTSATVARPSITLASWLNSIALNPSLTANTDLLPGASETFSFALGTDALTTKALQANYQYVLSNPSSNTLVVSSSSLGAPILPHLEVTVAPTATYQTLLTDGLINADMWDTVPRIMSAGYGFEGIQGVGSISDQNPTQADVAAAGGAWETITTPNPPAAAYTTALSPFNVAIAFGYPTYLADAMPVCFSWPVLPSTVSRKNFSVTLNTGEIVQPYVASLSPNLEYNERACVVIFGSFGNRIVPGTPGAIYPTVVTIVAGDAPLKLVGPNGPVSAVGLTKESTNPYAPNGGPTMNAAKISVMSRAGEGAPVAFSGGLPNDCVAWYGSGIQYRLRTFSTGGTSPDGVAAILPTDFAAFFQIQVTDPQGSGVSYIAQTGVPYTFSQGTIEVVGLADLGAAGTPVNDAFVADRDNQIDICLIGDRAAMKLITGINIPASGNYKPIYNPGGPGNDPTPGVTYTQPGKSQLVAVIQAIDNPMTVNYP